MAVRKLSFVVGFDYVGTTRGFWARLRNGAGHEVITTEFPGTLLSMLRAGVLVGEAKEDAERLRSAESADVATQGA